MMAESEGIKKLKNRDVLEEIRNKITEMQNAAKKEKEEQEQQRQEEHEKIIDDIFGE